MSKFYGIGVGVGVPEMHTIKAVMVATIGKDA